MHISIVILEDQKTDYELLSNQLDKWQKANPHTITITWLKNEQEIKNVTNINSYDILFSDIEIDKNSSNTGIDTCSYLRTSGFTGEIIFLTAFSEYVFDGYEVHAFNYLLKPITEKSLNNCMKKYIALHANDYYYFHKRNDIIQISYNDIICIHKDGHDVIIQTRNELYTERVSLSEVEKRLPGQFIRCHKSSIVNLMHIQSIVGSELYLSNNLKQTIGRSYLSSIRKAIIELANN